MGGLKNSSDFRPGNSTSLLWDDDFYYGRPQKFFRRTLHFWPGNSTSLLWDEDFLQLGGLKEFFTITLEFWPENSTSLLWEEDFLLKVASKILHNHFGFLAWEQHQFIMGGGFFIMRDLKGSSEGLNIYGLGTAPRSLSEEDFLLWEA